MNSFFHFENLFVNPNFEYDVSETKANRTQGLPAKGFPDLSFFTLLFFLFFHELIFLMRVFFFFSDKRRRLATEFGAVCAGLSDFQMHSCDLEQLLGY